MTQDLILSVLFLTMSVAFNAYQFIAIKKLKKKKVDSYEVKELLHDLLSGDGYVKVTRIAPTDFYLRRSQ